MRKIGLDLGSKTCGIAISDSTNTIASGLCNFQYKDNNMMLIIQKLKQIVKEYNHTIDIFVLGYPTYTQTQQKSNTTILVEKFAKLLNEHFKDIKVVYWDENYTTQKATSYLKDFEIKASQRKKIIDMVTSTFILQSYLDSNLK